MKEKPVPAPDEKKPEREPAPAEQSDAQAEPPKALPKHLPRPTRR